MQRSTIESAQCAECLKPGRYFRGGIRVHGTRTTVMAGVERSQQVDDFGAPNLADHDAVRPHSQRLPDKLTQRDLTGALNIDGSGHQGHHMGVFGSEFCSVLGADNPFGRIDRAEQRREQSSLAGTGTAGDKESQPSSKDGPQQICRLGGNRTITHELCEILCGGPQHSQRKTGSASSDGCKHRMQPHHRMCRTHTGQLPVDKWLCIIEAAPDRQGKTLRKPPDCCFIGELNWYKTQSVAVVNPDAVRSSDQYVGDTLCAQQWLQYPSTG